MEPAVPARLAGPPLEIRDAVEADRDALASLIGELGYAVEPELAGARLAGLVRGGSRALVAVENGRVVGLLTLHVTPVIHRSGPVGRLSTLVVAESARGRGVGRRLVAAGEEILASAGCVLVEVTSNRRREEAHRFYEHLGYELTSLRFAKALP